MTPLLWFRRSQTLRVTAPSRLKLQSSDGTNLRRGKAKGRLATPKVQLPQATLEDVQANISVATGVLTVTGAKAVFEGRQASARGSIRLRSPYHYRVSALSESIEIGPLAAQHFQIADLNGKLQLLGQATGTLVPLTVNANGRGRMKNIAWHEVELDPVDFDWRCTQDHLQLSNLHSNLLGGEVLVSELTYALSPSSQSRLVGQISVTNLAEAATAYNQAVRGPPLAVADAEGQVTLHFEFFDWANAETLNGQAQLEAQSIRLDSLPAENIHVKAHVRDGVVKVDAQADVFEGQLKLNGRGQFLADAQPTEADNLRSFWPSCEADVVVAGIAVQPLAKQLKLNQGSDVNGMLTAKLQLHVNESRQPELVGPIEVRDLSWNRKPLSRIITCNANLTTQRLDLDDLTADFAGGRFAWRLRSKP